MQNILIISTNHLGNKNYNNTLKGILCKLNISYEIIVLEKNEGRIKLPFMQLLESLYSAYIVYTKYKKLKKTFDIIFFHGSEFSFFFSKVKSKKIMSMDAPRYSIKVPGQKLYKHNPIRYKINEYLFRLLYKKKLSEINVFLPWSILCKNILIERYAIDDSKIHVIPTYLDLDVWSSSKESPIIDCVFVGNDLKRKGGEFLIEVFNKYLPDINLTIVTMDKISIRLNSNIRVLTGIQKDDLIKVYQQSRIFLFPTYFDQFGIVLTEAMACGIPIIMRNIGGGVELVQDSKAGIVLPYESSELDWAKSIRGILYNDELRNQYSLNARKYAEDNFSDEKNGKFLKELIEVLVVN